MSRILMLAVLVLAWTLPAQAAITLLDKDQWKIKMNGFVEVDGITDSTRSFSEISGAGNVQRPDNVLGETGRTQMSIRDSRLGFRLDTPSVDGWTTFGFLEMDFIGFDPAPGALQSEAAFFNNPTMRVRHAYLKGERDGWELVAGQAWGVIAFQPDYFIPSIQLISVAGMVFSRTTQARVLKNVSLNDSTKLQTVLALMRPPQRDAGLPGLEGGLRLILSDRTAGFVNGGVAPQKPQPASLAVTGTVREFVIPQSPNNPTGDLTHFPGSAVVVDGLFPIIASSDGKDPGNTLMLGGEFSTGKGYGDDFINWTGNQASPIASGAAATTAEKNVNLDGGIGDFDPNGNFALVDLRTFNAYAQYHFASASRTWMSAGYGRLYSDNVGQLTLASGKTGAGNIPYNRDEIYFANVQHDLTPQIRLGLEYAFIRTQYADAVVAHDNRYQLSAWFIF